MSSPVSKKRKADALEADGNNDNEHNTQSSPAPDPKFPATDSPNHLPAPCLAAVLNFLWYADVRQCMLAGKTMAVEAARHVETLNITKASELVVPAARRFSNVSEVNILCLLPVDRSNQDDESNSLLVVATRIVPFLAAIPNLKQSYIGRLVSRIGQFEMMWERTEYIIFPFEPHERKTSMFTTLMEILCGGFESRALKQNLKLLGILEYNQLGCATDGAKEHPSRPCHCCRRILSCFPLPMLVPSLSIESVFCVSPVDRILAVMDRDGAGAALRTSAGANMLLECLGEMIPRIMWISWGNEIDKAFEEKMIDLGHEFDRVSSDQLGMFWFGSTVTEPLAEFLDMVQSSSLLQDVMKDIPRSIIKSMYPFKKGSNGKHIFAREIFDMLLAAGLNLDANDYIIVDPEKEAALQPWL